MDYLLQGMFNDKSLSKVVGFFARQADADIAVRRLLRLPGMEPGQVRLLGPQHADLRNRDLLSRALEPETEGVFTTFVRTHAIAGLVGSVLGLMAFGYLVATRQPAVLDKPLLAFIAIVGFGTTFGLMLGALNALRPDRIWVVNRVRSALRKRQWVVVAHPVDSHQAKLAQDLLDSSEAQVVRTL
ncbi:hypothetical protein [Acidovorax sp.]|uniref:hypothetical protein n=1 Tax=Acidovorax sp. TaxID=1872122 RepID=UPI002ACDF35A|nr:hypothetical protein [Acidovorax sp.]MDZ7867433.1 hypothetical protein [Acidovorax sp.]